jgi:hypothetical protein
VEGSSIKDLPPLGIGITTALIFDAISDPIVARWSRHVTIIDF